MDSSTRDRGVAKDPLRAYAAPIAAVAAVTVTTVLLVVLLRDSAYAATTRMLVVGASLVAGLALGVAVAYAWDRYVRRLRTVSDIEAVTRLPVLGVIPTLRMKGADRVEAKQSRPAKVSAAYRHLATQLSETPEDAAGRCLLITSPTRRAGRTTIAVNLAASLAADGMTVVLVSADPGGGRQLDQLLGVRLQPGRTAVPGEPRSVERALQETGVERLRVLSTGAPVRRRGIGYGVDDLAWLLDRLTKRVDLVVIDAPPVLGGPETTLLAQEVDRILVAVDIRHDRKSDASLAMSYLGHVDDRLVGCVANDPGRLRHVAGVLGSAVGAMAAAGQRRRRWAGAVASAAALGLLVSTFWWLSYDQPSEAGQRTDRTADTTSIAATSRSAVEASMKDCRSAWDAQLKSLGAAADSLQQWQTHVTAMNQLVAGKITLDRANRFWERTRVQAAEKVERFSAADRAYTDADHSCRAPDEAQDADLAAFSACEKGIAQRDQALEAARVAIGTWHHHVMDMNLLRAGKMSPERAIQLWQKYWKQGVAQLNEYRTAVRKTEDLACS